jgi:hypothetical protein
MPAPELDWEDYEVEVEREQPIRLLLAIETFDAPAPTATVTVSIPKLTGFPSPLQKAEILLQSAAEVEHALMVQYLYAAYSLKQSREVSDPAQKAVLADTSPTSWPQTLLGIAREEMGHLMTVQNLLLLIGLAPNFEREDFPPRKDLYPFKLHLEPLSRRSLAKYVVAEAPADAPGIWDVVELATASAGSMVNRVGILYGLLGLVFTAHHQVDARDAGGEEWDDVVRMLAGAAYQQAPPEAWHLPDDAFHPGSLGRQGDPADWAVSALRVHRVGDRAAAVRAIRDIGEQGEGPTSEGEASHFERLLGIFRGHNGVAGFPDEGDWTPTRAVPTDPKVDGIGDARTKRWTELADIRYALLLGLLEHYLSASGDERQVLVGWIVAEMRSRLAHLALELTGMALGAGADARAAIPFTLPDELHLPADPPARWELHRRRSEAAIAKVEEIRAAHPPDAGKPFLTEMLASDRGRLEPGGAGPGPEGTSFARDIAPLFRLKDTQHMQFARGMDLSSHDVVRTSAEKIAGRLKSDREPMPPPPDQRWTPTQIELFERWVAEGCPP